MDEEIPVRHSRTREKGNRMRESITRKSRRKAATCAAGSESVNADDLNLGILIQVVSVFESV